MKRIMLAFTVFLAVSVSGCSLFQSKGDLDLASIEAIDKRFDKIAPKYIKYVEADSDFGGAGLTDEQRKKAKDDEKKAVESTGRLIDSVKNRLEKED